MELFSWKPRVCFGVILKFIATIFSAPPPRNISEGKCWIQELVARIPVQKLNIVTKAVYCIGDWTEKQRPFAGPYLQNMRYENESLIAIKFNVFISISEQ